MAPLLRSFLACVLASVLARALESPTPPAPPQEQQLLWLDQAPVLPSTGSTFGAAWPRGVLQSPECALVDGKGTSLPLQSWILATWPDGSVKWSGHSSLTGPENTGPFQLQPGKKAAAPVSALEVREEADCLRIDTGLLQAVIPRSGSKLVSTLVRNGRVVASEGSLVLWTQNAPEAAPGQSLAVRAFHGTTQKVTVEQAGPVRAVILIEGVHSSEEGDAQLLPFRVRLYFHAGSEGIRVLHSFIFDADENKDFIRGLGLRFCVPMQDPLYNRHVRFSGQEGSLFAEAVRGVTGLRRNPGSQLCADQVEGRALPPSDSWKWDRPGLHFEFVPAWGDYSLSQLSADGYTIRKRTASGHAWIDASAGRRSEGLAYLGGSSGGLSLGMRDFWRLHPSQIDIRGANTDVATITAWLWSPDAPAMDLRFYHDGMGMDTHEKQLQGLNITYEDYEPGFGSPYGVARSSELFLWAHASTPSRGQLAALAQVTALPPQLKARPEDTLRAGVFGLWSLPNRSDPTHALLEDRNDALIAHYRSEVEARRWYGFWNYGDVMHSYDAHRHVWRYDIGGYAWDNSELSPDLWLWLSYLRTGRADIFRFAEAMTRHTGEVDVHHLGRFQGLGSRHNVQHWGCSAKQMRISNAAYRRYYYFLTADERVGDLLRETVASAEAFMKLDPLRKVRDVPIPPPERTAVSVNFGTDWGAYSAAMLTQWERTGDPALRQRLESSMRTIGSQPRGFFTGMGFMDIDTSIFAMAAHDEIKLSHLSAVFGLPEMCTELLELIPEAGFEKAWLEYCRLYNAPEAEQRAALGQRLKGNSLTQGHARLTAYAALRLQDPALLKRAWSEFTGNGEGDRFENGPLLLRELKGFEVPAPASHIEGLSTNSASQWGLSLIQLLAVEARMQQ